MSEHSGRDSMTDDYRRLRELFDAALERPAAERRSFIDQACGGNTRLVAQVDRMLAADAATHAWMPRGIQPPADAPGPTICPSCRTPLLSAHRFCPACGTPVAGGPRAILR
jgi:hypothetical protein